MFRTLPVKPSIIICRSRAKSAPSRWQNSTMLNDSNSITTSASSVARGTP
jgi:hypothetical protein